MGTSEVFKVLKIARAAGECNLRSFYLWYSQQNYKRIHLWYVLQRETFVTFYQDLCARTPPV